MQKKKDYILQHKNSIKYSKKQRRLLINQDEFQRLQRLPREHKISSVSVRLSYSECPAHNQFIRCRWLLLHI